MQPLAAAMILVGPPVIPVQRKRPLSPTHDETLGRPGTGAESEQRLAAGGGGARASAWWPGGRGGLEGGLDGGGGELRGLRVDGDVAAEQHAADDLPGVPGRILRGRRPCQPSFLR